ncbi:MAG: caspase family protein, partial [Gemmatimonadota bacterium]
MTHRHLEPFLPSEVRNRPPERGRAHAVVVGIDAYPSVPLSNAVHDARAVARILEREYGFACTLLLDEAASRPAIERAVAAGLDEAGPMGRFLFYFAGHGEESSGVTELGEPARSAEPGRLLLAPGDETVPLPLPRLVDATLASACRQTLLVLDTCYSGQALFRTEDRDDRTSPDPRENRRVRQILCSGDPYQAVLDESPFTQSLLDALGGLAGIHDHDGTLRFDQLLPHMKQDVERRLRGAGERETTQSVVGGNLVGTTSRYGFTFVPIVPRIPGETVRRCLDEDPEERTRGLRDLVEDCRRQPERLPATIDLTGSRLPGHQEPPPNSPDNPSDTPPDTPPERPRGERLELVAAQRAFLEILASRPLDAGIHERMEATLAARLLRSTLRDEDPAVRHRARRGLRLVGGRTGARVRHVLEHRRSRSDPTGRRRAWETLAMLPAARRRLPVLSRIRAHGTAGRLWSGALRRTLTATRPRRLALATPPAALGLLYLVLAASYYVSTAGTTVVLRSGIPGLSALPGAGEVVVPTEFTLDHLEDPGTAREERLRGVWLPDFQLGLLGRDSLVDNLRPAEAGLTAWRLGDAESAVRRLHEAIEAGDGSAVAALAYLAFQSPEYLDLTVDTLVGALAGPDAARTAARSALGALRERHATRLGPVRARLAGRIDAAAPARRTALLEALGLLASPDAAEKDDLLGILIGSLRSAEAPELRERLAEIIAGSLEPDATVPSGRFRELADAAVAGPATVRRHLVPALARCAASNDEALREVERSAQRIVSETADAGERLSLLQALAPVLSRSPEMRELARSVTGDALRTAGGEILLEAIRTHLALPSGTDPPTAVVGPLVELITSDLDLALRSRALDAVLEELPGSPSAPLVRSLLTVASGGSAILREQALHTLIELALDRRIDAPTLAPLLPDALADPSIGVRLEAAKGLVLVGDRIDRPDIEQSRRQAVQVLFRVISSDDPLDRSLTADLPQRLQHTTRSMRARFLIELFSHASHEEDWVKIEFGNLVREVVDDDPAVLPSIISPLSERLADDDPAADYVYTVIYHLGELPEPHVRAAIDLLAQRLTVSSAERTTNSIRAMGALAASSPDL